MSKHEEKWLNELRKLVALKKKLKWYDFFSKFLIQRNINECKKEILWVRRLNGDYNRKIIKEGQQLRIKQNATEGGIR